MNKKIPLLALALTLSVTLGGCVNREQADALLVKGCTAGIGVLLPEGYKINRVLESKASPSPEGQGFRHVNIKAIENDGWLEVEKEYQCVFQESFGFLNMSHTASIHQIRFNDKVIGKSGNEIQGSFDEFMKLTDAIREAMYQ